MAASRADANPVDMQNITNNTNDDGWNTHFGHLFNHICVFKQ